MKCQHCGNNLNLEDEFCPYCGSPNLFAVKHQADMKSYKADYEDTKEDVITKSTKFNGRTARIAIASVLGLILVILIGVTFFSPAITGNINRRL